MRSEGKLAQYETRLPCKIYISFLSKVFRYVGQAIYAKEFESVISAFLHVIATCNTCTESTFLCKHILITRTWHSSQNTSSEPSQPVWSESLNVFGLFDFAYLNPSSHTLNMVLFFLLLGRFILPFSLSRVFYVIAVKAFLTEASIKTALVLLFLFIFFLSFGSL